LQFYKRVLALRHQEPALLDGKYIALNEDQPKVLSYLRRYKDQTVLVVLNMSGEKQKVSFDLTRQGISAARATTLVTTMSAHPKEVTLSDISLEPFAVYIARIVK
jgi:glycosidase